MTSEQNLARNVKTYRLLHGWTQEVFAKMLGFSSRGLGKIERGEVSSTLATLDKLAKGMGCMPGDLLKECDNTIQKALFVSVWDGGTRIETECSVNVKTGEVFDIELSPYDAEHLNHLDAEYIQFANGTTHPVYPAGQEEGTFWYEEDEVEEPIPDMSELESSMHDFLDANQVCYRIVYACYDAPNATPYPDFAEDWYATEQEAREALEKIVKSELETLLDNDMAIQIGSYLTKTDEKGRIQVCFKESDRGTTYPITIYEVTMIQKTESGYEYRGFEITQTEDELYQIQKDEQAWWTTGSSLQSTLFFVDKLVLKQASEGTETGSTSRYGTFYHYYKTLLEQKGFSDTGYSLKISGIVWDTEENGEEPSQESLGLPSEVVITDPSIFPDDYDAIADYLSDTYGYMVGSYHVAS